MSSCVLMCTGVKHEGFIRQRTRPRALEHTRLEIVVTPNSYFPYVNVPLLIYQSKKRTQIFVHLYRHCTGLVALASPATPESSA